MENDKLSIVVPIYNVEKYLRKCINSLINQTYKNIEIILVDDGSSDSSGNIADEYAEKDSKIKVIHKTNGGLADARNKGIEIATGKYIAFIDSDDWIDCDAYSYAIKMMKKLDSDMFVFQAQSCYNNFEDKINNTNEYILIENEDIFDYWGIIGRGVCDKVFLREYWNNIKFPFGKTSEDIFVIYKLMAKAQKTILSSNVYYYYRQREGSISKTKNVRIDSYYAYKNARKFIKEKYTKSYNKFMKNYLTNCMGIYNAIILYDNQNKWKKQMLKEISENKNYILKANVPIIKKVQILVLLHFKKIYYLIMKNKTEKENKKLFNNV